MFTNFRTFVPAVLIAMALVMPVQAQEAPGPRVITVTGEAVVAAIPDLAYVSIGVTEEATTAADALRAMSAAMTAVMARLEAAGIAPTDLQTGQLSLDPRYDHSGNDGVPKMTGFIATTMLDVRVRDLDLLGAVLDAVVQDGANRLGGVRFDLTDREPALDAARRDAVAVARARAELYADAAGVSLGALQSLSEQQNYGGPQPMFARDMAMEAMPVPMAAGEVNLSASVTLVYEIAE